MSNKTNIEEDIEIWKELIEQYKDYGFYGIIKPEKLKAIENILADRERLEKILKKSDANNIELQKEIEVLKNDTYWKGYIDKQNEAIEICKICKYKAKANKYDKLVQKINDTIEEIEDEFNRKNTPNNNEWYIDSNIYEYAREKLQELLDTEKEM